MTAQGCIEPIMLHWVQIAIIVSLRNRTARKRRTAKRVCVTNVTGLLLVCVVVIFTKFQCFGVFFNKICVKEDGWSLRQPFFKQNYCHARFAVFLALPSCCVSSLILKWLQQQTKSCHSTSLWAINRKWRRKRWLGDCKSKVGWAQQNVYRKVSQKLSFRKSFRGESVNSRNSNISDLYWALSVIKGANRQIDLRHLPKAHN